jgi:hypothetical protein
MFSFRVRAINFDNSREVDSLVSLFEKAFGPSLSLKEHLDSQSLCTSSDGPNQFQDLVSVVAYHKQQAVCHLGVCLNQSREEACLVFPAIHPDFIQCYAELNKGIRKQIVKLAKRQNWKRVIIETPGEEQKQIIEIEELLKNRLSMLKPDYSGNLLSSQIEIEPEENLIDEEVLVTSAALDNFFEEANSFEDAG